MRITICLILVTISSAVGLAQETQPTEIRLIARADDMGVAQGINEGCITAYKEGIVRSAEAIKGIPGELPADEIERLACGVTHR